MVTPEPAPGRHGRSDREGCKQTHPAQHSYPTSAQLPQLLPARPYLLPLRVCTYPSSRLLARSLLVPALFLRFCIVIRTMSRVRPRAA